MINYGAKAGEPSWYMMFKITGSVFPSTLPVVLPFCVLAATLKVLHNEGIWEDVTKMTFLDDFSSWGGFSGLVNFVIVFRLSHAFTTYWAAFTSTSQMLGDWSGAASSVVVFCRNTKADDASIEAFLHTVVRLFSMLSACALQELSPRSSHKIWGLLTLNSVSIDSKSIATLDGSPDRLGLVYHWIQQLLVDNQASGMLAAPAPIVGRAFGELGSGMGKFVDAKKHATEQFNFPYAQTTRWLLILYSALMPFMMVQWSDWVFGAFLFTFVQLFFTWSLNSITQILESPFDTSNPNCIDLFELQRGMNQSLLLLMHPMTRCGPPKLEKHGAAHVAVSRPVQKNWYSGYSNLEKRDTIPQAALKKEAWQLKSGLVLAPTSGSKIGDFDLEAGRACCRSSCCSSSKVVPREISVSEYYGAKRFGIIDEEKTAVFPLGIFGDHLLIAVPPACRRHRKRHPLLDVQSSSGLGVQVVVKSIQISDRHKLVRKLHTWKDGDFIDFRYECKDLVTDVFYARSKLLSIPLSKVSIEGDLEVDEQIESSKAVDKHSLGIETMVNLKSYELFCKQLIEHCGFEKQAAQDEWNKRKALPEKYEQGKDKHGRILIELDIEKLKDDLAKQMVETERKENMLKQAIGDIERAKSTGKIKELEDCIKKVEKDGVGLSTEQFRGLQKLLLDWCKIDEALFKAIEQRDLKTLESTLTSAEEVHLHTEAVVNAQKVRNDILLEKAGRIHEDIEAAKSSGKIDELQACIKNAEQDAVAESFNELDAARKLLITWRGIDEALSQASRQRDLQELEKILGQANEAKMFNDTYINADRVRNELLQHQALEAAKSSGGIAELEACLESVQKAAVAVSADAVHDAQNLLLTWRSVDEKLRQASEQRNLTELESAIDLAKEAKLNNDTRALAEKVLDELKSKDLAEVGEALEPKAEGVSPDAATQEAELPTPAPPGVVESEGVDLA